MTEQELKFEQDKLEREKKEFEEKKKTELKEKEERDAKEKKFEEDKKKHEDEKKKFEEDRVKEAADLKEKTIKEFIEKAKTEKKILPREEESIKHTLSSLDFEKTEKFGEKGEEKTPAGIYMDSILSRPDQSVFGEQGKVDKDGKPIEDADKTGEQLFDEAVDKYMADNEKVTDRAKAIVAVADASPELYAKYQEETEVERR